MTSKLPAVSNTTPLGCVSPPAIFVAFQPLATFTGKASVDMPAHVEGTPVCVGCGAVDVNTLVLSVVGRTEIGGVGNGTLLVAGGASCTRFAATSLSNSAF